MKRYFKDIYASIWTILIGMKVTFRHLFVPAVTIQYPDIKLKLPERARNRLYVNIDDCIGCDQCSMACPVDCITIETVKSLPTDDLGVTSDGHKKRLWVTKFDIDIAKCCYCGLCVPPCPTECILMTDVYEFSEFDRHNLIYNYSAMTPDQVGDVKEKYSQWEKDQAAKKAAAAAAKPAASAPPAAKPTAGPQTQTPDSKPGGSNQNG
jgi:NADH-quinone oxidoreductase chain I